MATLDEVHTAVCRVEGKVDEVDKKVDGHAERIVKVETKQDNHGAILKWVAGIFSIVLAGIIIALVKTFLKGGV